MLVRKILIESFLSLIKFTIIIHNYAFILNLLKNFNKKNPNFIFQYLKKVMMNVDLFLYVHLSFLTILDITACSINGI